ncbi:MAG: hypothetical protein ACOYJD_00955 [Christensenellales bacterium]|jgi:hypothetical protein
METLIIIGSIVLFIMRAFKKSEENRKKAERQAAQGIPQQQPARQRSPFEQMREAMEDTAFPFTYAAEEAAKGQNKAGDSSAKRDQAYTYSGESTVYDYSGIDEWQYNAPKHDKPKASDFDWIYENNPIFEDAALSEEIKPEYVAPDISAYKEPRTAHTAPVASTVATTAQSSNADKGRKLKLNFSDDDLIRAIVMSEVLGKPKALQR